MKKYQLFILAFIFINSLYGQVLKGDNYKTLFKNDQELEIMDIPTPKPNIYNYDVIIKDTVLKCKVVYCFTNNWKLRSIIFSNDSVLISIGFVKSDEMTRINRNNKLHGIQFLLNKKNKLIAILKYDKGELIDVIYLDKKEKLNQIRNERLLFLFENV